MQESEEVTVSKIRERSTDRRRIADAPVQCESLGQDRLHVGAAEAMATMDPGAQQHLAVLAKQVERKGGR